VEPETSSTGSTRRTTPQAHGHPTWVASIEALLRAVDDHIPVPVRYVDAPFLLPVENVLTVTGAARW
jgi:translation elongation factor EF-Tu-like GTPase